MKKLIFLSFSILFSLGVKSQIDIDKSKTNSAYLKFLPSNANPEDLRPSDIPSEQVLKQIGLKDSEIIEAMNFKYGRGKYSQGIGDTVVEKINVLKFYESFGDTLVIDTISYPKAKIYGQDCKLSKFIYAEYYCQQKSKICRQTSKLEGGNAFGACLYYDTSDLSLKKPLLKKASKFNGLIFILYWHRFAPKLST